MTERGLDHSMKRLGPIFLRTVTMSFSSKAVANKFLELAQRDNVEVSPMKLQKLVYYAHGWYYAIVGEPLIDEQIEAWKYGPVVPSLFYSAKHYGNAPIDKPLDDFELVDSSNGVQFNWSVEVLSNEPESEQAVMVIEQVWEVYGSYSAIKLSNMTHEEDGPWHKTLKDNRMSLPKGTDIPPEYIREHFSQSLNHHLSASLDGN